MKIPPIQKIDVAPGPAYAFPIRGETFLHFGMTLRDYFAAAALQGLIAQAEGSALRSDSSIGAEFAYEMADAMMKARGVKS